MATPTPRPGESSDADDIKAKFREALERKKSGGGGGPQSGAGRQAQGSTHGAETKRMFRRKSG